jgi:putative ATPase
VGPLLSRSLLLTLEPLADDDIRTVVRRALTEDRGLGGALALDLDAEDHLLRLAGGDARRALTALEAAAGAAQARGATAIDLATLEAAVDRAAVRYDRDGDQHYDVTSGYIKSIRGGDVDAALHYLARMLTAGEDPRFVARRLVILASEDIGLADPTALQTAVAAAHALELVGLPEARLNLAQATIHLALAPKSNAVITAVDAATADIRAGRTGPVPRHLRDTHYPGARRIDHGGGYRYPHDFPEGVVAQQYPPDAVVGREYYRPTVFGAERGASERLAELRATVRANGPEVGGAPADGAPAAFD